MLFAIFWCQLGAPFCIRETLVGRKGHFSRKILKKILMLSYMHFLDNLEGGE